MPFKIIATSVVAIGYLLVSMMRAWPPSEVVVVFCDVGQGDATLILDGFTQVLVDSGPDETVLSCLNEFLPWWDRKLEVIVATHADKDHIGGFSTVLGAYQVTAVITVVAGKNTSDFKEFRSQVLLEKAKGAKLYQASTGQRLKLSQAELLNLVPLTYPNLENIWDEKLTETQLSAMLESHENLVSNHNDGSIGTFLSIGEVGVWLAADQEIQAELALIEQGLTKNIDVLKAGHHGSNTSNTLAFLEKVLPEYTVISSGSKNSYGHPNAEVLARLDLIKSKVLRTDQLGSIVLRSNGQGYRWDPE